MILNVITKFVEISFFIVCYSLILNFTKLFTMFLLKCKDDWK